MKTPLSTQTRWAGQRLKRLAVMGSLSALLLVSTGASADETPAISGVFDGETANWYLHSQNGDTSATFVEQNATLVVDITGFAEPDEQALRESLALRLRLASTGAGTRFALHLVAFDLFTGFRNFLRL